MMNKAETIKNLKKTIDCVTVNPKYCFEKDNGCSDCEYRFGRELYEETLMSALMLLQKGIDAEPVVHGKWIDNNDDFYPSACHCSVCGMDALTEEETDYDYVKSNYCPHCGAVMDSRMDGDEE